MSELYCVRLLVEGVDDCHVTIHVLTGNNVNSFRVKDCNGYSNVKDLFKAELKASDSARIGIIVDADGETGIGGPEPRWESLKHLLGECGYKDLPAEMPQEGLIAVGGEKPVGLWLMPDNTSMGMLEHFMAELVPEGDRLWDRACQSVNGIPEPDRRFKPQAKPKAEVHTWLAWQEEPGTPLGLAVKKKYFDPSAPTAQAFVNWVNRLLAVEVPE
ncbi:MAG: hypothetical protein IH602_02440 [Bryobacteraceae bacterium]|nr:hypothetical protein [Bryobacteraceae bacterium]